MLRNRERPRLVVHPRIRVLRSIHGLCCPRRVMLAAKLCHVLSIVLGLGLSELTPVLFTRSHRGPVRSPFRDGEDAWHDAWFNATETPCAHHGDAGWVDVARAQR